MGNITTVMPAQASIQFLKRMARRLVWIPALAGMTIGFMISNALAADPAPATPTTYSPDYCQFSAAFPDKPYVTHQCAGDGKSKCYDQVSYTKVFDLAATVNIKVICSQVEKDVYTTYSPEIMEKTLEAMTDKNIVKKFDSSFREEKTLGYKQAGLVGEGKVGELSTIYIAQLWIADHSAFSVEAEMIGDKNDNADKLFSEVLKSVHFVGDKKPGDKKPDDKKDDKKTETPAPTTPSTTPAGQ